MDPSNTRYVSNMAMFHFHDYGGKSKQSALHQTNKKDDAFHMYVSFHIDRDPRGAGKLVQPILAAFGWLDDGDTSASANLLMLVMNLIPVLLLMAEILHQLIGSSSHYLQGFSTIQTVVGNGISEPSTVVLVPMIKITPNWNPENPSQPNLPWLWVPSP